MMNPLEHFIHIAQSNLALLQSDYFKEESTKISKEIARNMLNEIPKNIELCQDNSIGYKTIELAGIAQFFKDIENNLNEELIYENTLGMTLHGIDAISKDIDGTYTIYEIKGTTRKLRSARSYLKKTRKRGRQLTWKWCWASLVDMAEFPLTASVFLALYEDIIFKRVKRKLSIIECQKEEDNSYTGKDIHTFDFDLLDIIDDYSMSKQERMLTSLKERKAS